MSSDITQTYADKLPRHALAQRAAAQTPQPGALQTRASAPSLARSLAALDTAEHVSGAAGKARIARAMQHALGNTRIARMGCSSCGDAEADAGPLQRRPVGPEGSDQVPPSVERALASSHGQPLPRDTQTRMERAFGASLGDVRVHTGEQSARANRDISAAAFTAGRDIHFAPGRYNPGSAEGQHLLAHELTHVVQQRSGRVPGGSPRIGPAGDAFEHEADQTANAVRRAMAAPAGMLEEDEGGAAASTMMPQRTMSGMPGAKNEDEAEKPGSAVSRTLAPTLAQNKRAEEEDKPAVGVVRAMAPLPGAKPEDEANKPAGTITRAMTPMPGTPGARPEDEANKPAGTIRRAMAVLPGARRYDGAAMPAGGTVMRVFGPTGDCTQARYNVLNAAVYAACKGPGQPRSCARGAMTCAQLRANQQRFGACAMARQNRETECWRGGDAGHLDQIQQNQRGAATCRNRANRRRCA